MKIALPGLTALCICILGLSRCTLAAERPASAEIDFTPDIVYGKGGDTDLKLDLAKPQKLEKPVPCIVVIHGGGWSAGNRQQHDDIVKLLAHRGYVAVTVEYRLAPAFRFPAQVEDVKCAVRFLRAHAKNYNIDPDRIGAVGFSAGAHLAMMLGLTRPQDKLEGDGGWADQSSAVQAVVSFFGPTDLSAHDIPPITKPILKAFLDGTCEQKPQEYKRASPVTYVHAGAPPMLLLQGTLDPLVPDTQAILMAGAMTKAGIPGRVELLIGLGHGWGGADLARSAEDCFSFFAGILRLPAKAGK